MPAIIIDQRDFLRGVSAYDDVSNGGYSPLSVGISPFYTPGLIAPGPNPSSTSTTGIESRGIFAWATWYTAISPGIGRGLSANASKDGKFISIGSSGSTQLDQTDTGRDYEPIISDMVRYNSLFYVTSNTDIAELNGDFTVADFDFWTVTKAKGALTAGAPHPMVVYGDILYIADKNVLHQLDGTTATEDVLVLPNDYTISALEIYQNLIFISASKFSDATGGTALESRIFTWNGYSPTFIDEFVTQERTDAMKVFGGALLITTPSYVGYWTGSTVNVLRHLETNVYKHQIAIDRDRLYLAQGTKVLCLGNPILANPKNFSFPIKTEDTIIGLSSWVSERLFLSFNNSGLGAQALWVITDLDAANDTGVSFYSNKTSLGTYGYIKKVIIESEPLSSGADMDLFYINSSGTTVTVGEYSHALWGAVSYHEFEVFDNEPTFFFQLKATWNSTPKAIRRAYVIFEPAELRPNK